MKENPNLVCMWKDEKQKNQTEAKWKRFLKNHVKKQTVAHAQSGKSNTCKRHNLENQTRVRSRRVRNERAKRPKNQGNGQVSQS